MDSQSDIVLVTIVKDADRAFFVLSLFSSIFVPYIMILSEASFTRRRLFHQ